MKLRIIRVLALCLCLLLISCSALAQTVSLAYKSGSLNVRKGPGKDYKSVDVVYHGDHIVIEEYGDVWTKIRTPSGVVGYIKNVYIDDGDEDYAAGTEYVSSYTVYTTTRLNFRAGASTSTKSMGVFNKGTKLTVLGKNGSFLLVKDSHGSQGYVSKKYVTKSKSGSSGSSGSEKTKTVKAKAVNLREGGGISTRVLRVVPYGAKVTVIKEGKYWTKVKYKGTVGWIKKTYLK